MLDIVFIGMVVLLLILYTLGVIGLLKAIERRSKTDAIVSTVILLVWLGLTIWVTIF